MYNYGSSVYSLVWPREEEEELLPIVLSVIVQCTIMGPMIVWGISLQVKGYLAVKVVVSKLISFPCAA